MAAWCRLGGGVDDHPAEPEGGAAGNRVVVDGGVGVRGGWGGGDRLAEVTARHRLSPLSPGILRRPFSPAAATSDLFAAAASAIPDLHQLP